MFKEKVYGPFFFAESTVNGTSSLDMMQEWLMMTVMTSFVSKVGLCHTTTTSCAATSISICHNIGSDARLPMTRRCFAGHPDHLI
jgi:hypothetical protein